MVQRLVDIVGELEGERSITILRKMIKHPSERVRRSALMYLVARDSSVLRKVFPSIEDTSEVVRSFMLEHLGQCRSESAESLLLDYLEQRRFRLTNPGHLFACYRALGRCGSARSIPFLQRTLFNEGWIPGFSRSTHRQGAAIALMALGTEKAKNTLQKASRSLFPSVRLAYRRAMEMTQWKVVPNR